MSTFHAAQGGSQPTRENRSSTISPKHDHNPTPGVALWKTSSNRQTVVWYVYYDKGVRSGHCLVIRFHGFYFLDEPIRCDLVNVVYIFLRPSVRAVPCRAMHVSSPQLLIHSLVAVANVLPPGRPGTTTIITRTAATKTRRRRRAAHSHPKVSLPNVPSAP